MNWICRENRFWLAFTFLMLSKGANQQDPSHLLEQFVPLYARISRNWRRKESDGLRSTSQPWLLPQSSGNWRGYEKYTDIFIRRPPLSICFCKHTLMPWTGIEIVDLPVQGIGLDFVAGKKQNLKSMQTHGFPKDKVLGSGLVDGRNIWRHRFRTGSRSDIQKPTSLRWAFSVIIKNEYRLHLFG